MASAAKFHNRPSLEVAVLWYHRCPQPHTSHYSSRDTCSRAKVALLVTVTCQLTWLSMLLLSQSMPSDFAYSRIAIQHLQTRHSVSLKTVYNLTRVAKESRDEHETVSELRRLHQVQPCERLAPSATHFSDSGQLLRYAIPRTHRSPLRRCARHGQCTPGRCVPPRAVSREACTRCSP